jgi:hypothetical protein
LATVLTVGDSEGTRRCDATCHEAKGPRCECVCGGRYHGCGSSDKAKQLVTEDVLGGRLGDTMAAAARAALDGLAERQAQLDAGQQVLL